MLASRDKIKHLQLNSLPWVLVLALGLFIVSKMDHEKSVRSQQQVPFEISIRNSSATISAGVQYNIIRKNWIPNEDSFRLLTFNQIKFLENSEADRDIHVQKIIKDRSAGLLLPIIHNKLLPSDHDEIPILG